MMTNREMLDKYKELIIRGMDRLNEIHIDQIMTDLILQVGEALEKYIWMDNELKEEEQDKDKETE